MSRWKSSAIARTRNGCRCASPFSSDRWPTSGLSLGYGTDVGARGEVSLRYRNVFGRGYDMHSALQADSTRQIGYADFHLPPGTVGTFSSAPLATKDSVGFLAEHTDIQGLDTRRVAVAGYRQFLYDNLELRLGLVLSRPSRRRLPARSARSSAPWRPWGSSSGEAWTTRSIPAGAACSRSRSPQARRRRCRTRISSRPTRSTSTGSRSRRRPAGPSRRDRQHPGDEPRRHPGGFPLSRGRVALGARLRLPEPRGSQRRCDRSAGAISRPARWSTFAG